MSFLLSIPQHAIFDWNEETQGFVLSSFYYGYAATQILGGFLIQKFGAKWVLGIGMLSTALFTAAVPVLTRWGGMSWLFALRVIQGMGEVSTFLQIINANKLRITLCLGKVKSFTAICIYNTRSNP